MICYMLTMNMPLWITVYLRNKWCLNIWIFESLDYYMQWSALAVLVWVSPHMIRDFFKHKHMMLRPVCSLVTDVKTSKIQDFCLLGNKLLWLDLSIRLWMSDSKPSDTILSDCSSNFSSLLLFVVPHQAIPKGTSWRYLLESLLNWYMWEL